MPTNASLDLLYCSYASVCSGCDWLLKPADEQRDLKVANLKATWREHGLSVSALPEPHFISVDRGALRDRVDLTIDQRSGSYRIGIFDRFRTGLVDLQGCPQMSPALEAWFQNLRKIRFPIERGSIRLRVSPSGIRGIWLDFANVDVKTLLDERTTLDLLRTQSIVEIGQKRKRLVEKDGLLKLSDPVLEPWFETYSEQNGKFPLYCTIGSFTQPGFRANHALVREVMRLTTLTQSRKIVEFGSGIGNFTLPLASLGSEVQAYEVDSLALEGLKKSLTEQNLASRVKIHSGNFQGAKAQSLNFETIDLMFVDPPRSGLMMFLDPLIAMPKEKRPRYFIYVSCFAESFAQDSARLLQLGYISQSVSIVDQFPQSRHYEIVALFEKS